jgi:hypothetical protein
MGGFYFYLHPDPSQEQNPDFVIPVPEPESAFSVIQIFFLLQTRTLLQNSVPTHPGTSVPPLLRGESTHNTFSLRVTPSLIDKNHIVVYNTKLLINSIFLFIYQ